MKKFERAGHDKDRKDEVGDVVIRINLWSKTPVKGNLSKSIRIKESRVSEVYTALEKILFG